VTKSKTVKNKEIAESDKTNKELVETKDELSKLRFEIEGYKVITEKLKEELHLAKNENEMLRNNLSLFKRSKEIIPSYD
jgi:predicted RNase H-like nuclease (RuvC/YqgF family)